ncbi:LLM class flavin-dependent oxidoreductase [Pseudomonas aeruginosa]|nr:LLM class flavin-dependent oxidoreductase [Pseudomonas aeruginosa]
MFRPDVSSLPLDVLETGSGFASLDPTVLLAAVARETSRIGLVSTVSTTFYPPYVVARQLQSLHWISNGRAGWNIVTALQGHENFGLDAMPDAEQRYARAAEFTRLVHDLWDSFPREALLVDRESGRYADVSRVHPVDHDGEFLKVKGPLNLPAFGEARIPLVQAGASESGRDFAASVADLVFAPTPDKEAARNCAATFPAAPNATVARRATCACCRASACTWRRAARRRGKSSCRPTRAWTARASSPRSGRCSASTSATGRWTGRFPRPTCRRRWPTPAAAPTPTCCGA